MVARALSFDSEEYSESPTFEALWTAYRRSLVARRRSPATLAGKDYTARLWASYRQAQGWPDPPADWKRQEVEHFISHLLATKKPATAQGHYRILHSFCAWCVSEDEIDISPMAKMHAPSVPSTPPPVLDTATIERLLEACKGRGLCERRDTAIILLLSATGMRRGELVGMKCADVNLEDGTAVISGKTGTRTVPFPAAVCVAIDRYLRVRSSHRRAALPALWLGHFGAVTGNGVLQILQRRARVAGIRTRLYPHLLRHTATHNLLAAGVSELDVETLLGWSSSDMLRRYGASMRTERAINSYRKLFQ
jgi:site-specific recombinase XerD